MIVNDPEKAEEVLLENHISVSIIDVMVVSIPDEQGNFAKIMRALADAGQNIEYAYAFLTPEAGFATVIVRVDDPQKGTDALKTAGIRVLEQGEII